MPKLGDDAPALPSLMEKAPPLPKDKLGRVPALPTSPSISAMDDGKPVGTIPTQTPTPRKVPFSPYVTKEVSPTKDDKADSLGLDK